MCQSNIGESSPMYEATAISEILQHFWLRRVVLLVGTEGEDDCTLELLYSQTHGVEGKRG